MTSIGRPSSLAMGLETNGTGSFDGMTKASGTVASQSVADVIFEQLHAAADTPP